MNDREFDTLLSESLHTYGHEYLHGADGPLETGPAPVHQFPDNFLDDVFPQKKKKPVILRLMPYIAATAALFVITVAVVLAAQFGSGGDDGFVGMVGTVNSQAANDADKSISSYDASGMPSYPDTAQNAASAINDTRDASYLHSTDSYIGKNGEVYDVREDPDTAYEAADSTPNADAAIDDAKGTSQTYRSEITYNGERKTSYSYVNEALVKASAALMTDKYHIYSSLPVDSGTVILKAVISPENSGETIQSKGMKCSTLTIIMTENALTVTAVTEDGIENYLIPSDSTDYASFATGFKALLE